VLEPAEAHRLFRMKPFGFGGEGPLVQDADTIREMIHEGRGGSLRD